MTQPPADPPSRRPHRSLPERRRRERRIFALGLALSVVLHALGLSLAAGWLNPDPGPAPDRPTALIAEPPRGMRAVRIRETAEPEPTRPVEPEPPAPDQPVEPAPVVVAEAPVAPDSALADARTAADRLAPRVVDPRLWRPRVLLPDEPTLADVEARIAAAVELLSDSALAATEAAVRARDWTVEDSKGGKWGISPGKLHLGSLTLPLPLFPVSREVMVQNEMMWELERQLDRTLFLESFEERVRAIRERRERERAEARSGENGGG